MSYTASNWALTSYTNSTWTTLVDNSSGAQAVILFNIIASIGANAASVEMRLASSGPADRAMLLESYAVNSGESLQLNKGPIVVLAGDYLQIYATAQSIEFSAHGAY